MERRPRAHVLVFIFFGCLLLMRFEVLSAGYRIRPDDLACCQELEHNLMERWPRARPCQKMFSALPFTRHDLARALARPVFFYGSKLSRQAHQKGVDFDEIVPQSPPRKEKLSEARN